MFWKKPITICKKKYKFSGTYYFNRQQYICYVEIAEDIINQIKNIMKKEDANCWDKMIRILINDIYQIKYPSDMVDRISFGCNEQDDSKYININIKSCYSELVYPYPIKPNNKVKLRKIYMAKNKK